MSELSERLGRRIRQLRQLNNLTQEKLAELAEINVTFLGHIERGIKNPTVETLGRIAASLNISLSELFVFEDISKEADEEARLINELLLEYSDKIRKIYKKD